jgi:hypothetical protein
MGGLQGGHYTAYVRSRERENTIDDDECDNEHPNNKEEAIIDIEAIHTNEIVTEIENTKIEDNDIKIEITDINNESVLIQDKEEKKIKKERHEWFQINDSSVSPIDAQQINSKRYPFIN